MKKTKTIQTLAQELMDWGVEVPELKYLFSAMCDIGATDLLIAHESPVLYRIDGEIIALNQKALESDDVGLMLAECVSSADIEVLERTKELNTVVSIPSVGRFRISAFYQRGTMAFVTRYIPNEVPSFDSLSLPPLLPSFIELKRGLILVCGQNGSGKSTTIASLIDHRNAVSTGHILTVEDPIEYLLRNKKSIVNQREIGVDSLSYEQSLKNALRQSPDVIVIGEIRDAQSMGLAMQYANSGHLCVASLHANNSYSALNRIFGFFPADQRQTLCSDLATCLRVIVSQRLVPSISGSRVAAMEILVNNKGISDLIHAGQISSIADLMEKSGSDGSLTFEEDLCRLMDEGKITSPTALLHCDSPTNLHWRMSQSKSSKDEYFAKSSLVENHNEDTPHNAPTSFPVLLTHISD